MTEQQPAPATATSTPKVSAPVQVAPDAEYSQSDFVAQASSLGTTIPEIAGVFRELGKATLTEAEFTAGVAKWRGES